MSLTREELELTLREVTSAVTGGRIEKIAQHGERKVVFEIYSRGERHWMLWSVEAGLARAHLLPERPGHASVPDSFVQLCRKHATGARVAACELWEGDRVVRLDGIRGPERVSLLAELTGRHGNIFLLDGDDRILGSLLPNPSRKRDLRPGQPYLYPIPRALPSRPARFGPESPGAAAHALFVDLEEQAHEHGLTNEIGRALRAERKRIVRRREAIEGDLARAAQAPAFREAGELIVANLHAIKRGATSARLIDYTTSPPGEREVELDPALSPRANAERYFHRYRKYRKGQETIEGRLRRAERELETLAVWEAKLEAAAGDAESLGGLRADLVERGLLRGTSETVSTRVRPAEEPAQPYRRFVSRDGQPILVGKGSASNETLTFKVARGNDLWMHTRDYPGAHVVVRLGKGEEVAEQTLLDAATLAVHFSGAKGELVAEVSYTRRKHVFRPKGAPQGTVALSESRTLAVRTEPERLERLLRRKDLGG